MMQNSLAFAEIGRQA